MEKSLSKIINGTMMCLEGQELLLKGNSMIYDELAMMDDAHGKLSTFCPEKTS